MEDFINSLNNKFMELYNTYIEKNEYDPILTNGFCLYFVLLLKKIFPEGDIYYTKSDHYIFFLNDDYYDGNGKIFRSDNNLIFFFFGEIKKVRIEDLYFIENIEEERNILEIRDFDYKYKEYVWQIIEGPLIDFAMMQKKEIMNYKRNLQN